VETNEDLFILKIIDFGTAKIFDKNKKERALVGSSYYIAPEVINKKYNQECDMWSAGVILYMFIVGHAPFDGKTDREIMEKIKKGNYLKNEERWINSSKEVKDLIQKLLVLEPEKRLTAKQALKHPWFKVTNSNILYNNISKEEVLKCVQNLLNYKINSKFEEMVLAYIIHSMPRPKEAKTSIKLFKLANKNEDGKLLRNELKETLLNFVSEEFLSNYDEIFSQLDGDNNGYIDYEEFLRATLDRKSFVNLFISDYFQIILILLISD
jgi:calcium-dependent protein kinase